MDATATTEPHNAATSSSPRTSAASSHAASVEADRAVLSPLSVSQNSPAATRSGPGQTFEVLLFASLRDVAGEKIEVVLGGDANVAELLKQIGSSFPALAPWTKHVRVAVNCEYAGAEQKIEIGDEIAILPPVSGGAESTVEIDRTWTLVTEAPLDVVDIMSRAERCLAGGAGAIVPFVGIVRNNARGQSVTHLEYQAYGAMAEAEMRRIAGEANERWNCACALAHRTGRLEIGEASLVVAVASAHRVEAFEACRWVVDEIKLRVPVWKKEHAANGTFWIEDPLQSAASTPETEPSAPAVPDYRAN